MAAETRLKHASDPDRPLYHFLAPSNYMGDPNGTLYWKGRYHLFYQWNPYEPEDRHMHWGHAVSEDLLHWTDLPIALAPEPEGPDPGGCYSGGSLINMEGVPTLVYHGAHKGTCIATSTDDFLVRWTKHPANPVIRTPQPGDPDYGKYALFDPTAWIEGDTYYALVGNKIPGVEGDATSLFKSPDLLHWEHIGPFYQSERRWTRADEDCAVPNFFPLGNKHMLLFASHKRGAQYYIGDYSDHRFYPELHGLMNYGDFTLESGTLVAPITFADEQGRRIFFAWITEGRHFDVARAKGWYGVMSLPRVVSLSERGTLRIEPAPELEGLRTNHRELSDRELAAEKDLPLEDISGECLELTAVLQVDSSVECGVKVRCSPQGEEQTRVIFNPARKELTLDASKSSLSPEVVDAEPQTGPLELDDGEALELRIFVDRTVVEVFANEKQCLTKRIYPSRSDSQGVTLFAHGGSARLVSLDAWTMKPVWPVTS
jgi:beta-fructofuranosidase